MRALWCWLVLPCALFAEEPVYTPPSYEAAFIKMICSLVGILLLVGVTVWMLKRLGRLRRGGAGSDKAIRILERHPLSQKSVLYLVEVGKQRVLLAESQLEVRRLAVFEEPVSPPE